MDVSRGQVGRVDRCVSLPGGKIDGDHNFTSRHVDKFPWLADPAVPADPHTVDGHREPLGLEHRAGRADRGEDPPPVRVLAVQRALDQLVAGDRPGDFQRIGLRRGALRLHRDVLRRPFGVRDELAGELCADLFDGARELGGIR